MSKYKYTVFSDGSISHYMEEDEHIKDTYMFSTLPPARAKALALLAADCKERLLTLSKLKITEID